MKKRIMSDLMGIEADKEEIGSIVWVDRCKFAQDRANAGDHNTSDIGVLWAEDHIATQAATIEALESKLDYPHEEIAELEARPVKKDKCPHGLEHDFNWKYKISNIRVYDGDTITADIDLGANIIMHDQKIRLYGINTPEIRTKDEKEKILGYHAKHYLERLLGVTELGVEQVWIESHKDKKGKFGRWLGTIYVDGMDVNQEMFESGNAVIAEY